MRSLVDSVGEGKADSRMPRSSRFPDAGKTCCSDLGGMFRRRSLGWLCSGQAVPARPWERKAMGVEHRIRLSSPRRTRTGGSLCQCRLRSGRAEHTSCTQLDWCKTAESRETVFCPILHLGIVAWSHQSSTPEHRLLFSALASLGERSGSSIVCRAESSRGFYRLKKERHTIQLSWRLIKEEEDVSGEREGGGRKEKRRERRKERFLAARDSTSNLGDWTEILWTIEHRKRFFKPEVMHTTWENLYIAKQISIHRWCT